MEAAAQQLREQRELGVLFIDISSKRWTRYLFNDWVKHEEGGRFNATQQQNRQRIKELLERLKVNYVVYERFKDSIGQQQNSNDVLKYLEFNQFFNKLLLL